MKLRFFNTLTGKKENFVPLSLPLVGYYSCGPTVYDFAHIGHARTYVFADLLERVLKFNGYRVKRVMNITDVGHLTSDQDTGEDKMEKGAKREGKTVWEIADFYTADFFQMLEKLNIQRPQIICRATDNIPQMIALIKILEKKGFTYRLADGIYFATEKLPDYGKLLHLSRKKLQKSLKAGFRIEMVPGKRQPTDFALWKFSLAEKGKPRRQMEWWFTGPFRGKLYRPGDEEKLEKMTTEGKITSQEKKEIWETLGFPGWHIECSAMSMRYLGETFDIHTGGVDHIPIHHTNEIAQSEAATNRPFVRFWLHAAHLLVEGKKMSKSLGNFYRVADLEKRGFSPLALRYLFLTAHYRQEMNFTWEALSAAQKSLENLFSLISSYRAEISPKKKSLFSDRSERRKIDYFREKFWRAVNEDLNLPQALGVLWKAVKSNLSSQQKYRLSLLFDEVLGLGLEKIKAKREEEKPIPQEIRKKVEEREVFRKEKKWSKADKIRAELKKKGFWIEDTPKGPKIVFSARKK